MWDNSSYTKYTAIDNWGSVGTWKHKPHDYSCLSQAAVVQE